MPLPLRVAGAYCLLFLVLLLQPTAASRSRTPIPTIDEDAGLKLKCSVPRCGKGKALVPKRPWRIDGFGCSGLGLGPPSQGLGDENMHRDCCDLRHACFQTCGVLRRRCVEDFEGCMLARCKVIAQRAAATKKGDEGYEDAQNRKTQCYMSARLHMITTNMGKCESFETAQQRACYCMDLDRVDKRKRQVLEDFYKKHNEGKLDETQFIDKLVETKTTARQFGTLLYKLVKRYPAAIVDKRPESKSYEEILSEGGDRQKKKVDQQMRGEWVPGADKKKKPAPVAAAGGVQKKKKQKKEDGDDDDDDDDADDDEDARDEEEIMNDEDQDDGGGVDMLGRGGQSAKDADRSSGGGGGGGGSGDDDDDDNNKREQQEPMSPIEEAVELINGDTDTPMSRADDLEGGDEPEFALHVPGPSVIAERHDWWAADGDVDFTEGAAQAF